MSPARSRSAPAGLASARERFERRAASARRRPRLLWGSVIGLVLALALAVWVLWFSALVTAQQVQLAPTTKLPAAETARLIAVAAVPTGVPLLRVDTDAVATRLTTDKALRDVSVERRFPHTIVLHGTPRVATLAVKNAEGQVEVVDELGTVFRTQAAAPKGVPLVSADSPNVSAAGRLAALECLTALPVTLRAQVSGVTVSGADQVTFNLTVSADGKRAARTVIWGGRGDSHLKARVLGILLAEPGSTIDVSVPTSPVTR